MSKYEHPDPQPVAIPSGFKEPESLEQMMLRLIRHENFAQAMTGDPDAETFDEANDFEIDDDMFDPSSPYEEVFDPTLGRGITHDEFIRHEETYRKRFEEAHARAYREMELSDALRARPRPPAKQSGREAPPNPPPASGEE